MGPKVTTLNNGLKIVSEFTPNIETVSVGVWVGVGSRHERPEQNGIAHFLEHMMFKGTEKRSAKDIAQEIEAVGGQINAYTTREYTTYYSKVLKENMDLAIDILSDILQNSVFDPKETEREREVILQEIGQANDTPDDIIFDFLQATSFPSQSLGRAILGTEDIVSTMTSDKLHAFKQLSYTAKEMVVGAVGNVDHDDFVEKVAHAFSNLPDSRGLSIIPAQYQGGQKRHDRSLDQLHLAMAFPGVSLKDKNYYAMQTLSTMLGGGMSSRLFQSIREEKGLAYSVYSFTGCFEETGILGIYAGTGPEMAEELCTVLSTETRKLITTVTNDELERAKTQLKAGMMMALENTSARLEQWARQLMIYNTIVTPAEISKRVDAVSLKEAQNVGEYSLSSAPVTLAFVGPGIQVPEVTKLDTMFKL